MGTADSGATDELARFPLSGHLLRGFTEEPICELLVESWRVIHRTEKTRVVILSIKHVREEISHDDLRLDYP